MRRTWKVLRSLWQTVTMSPISSSKDSAVIACKSTSLPLSADYSMWTSASSASCCIRDLSDLEVLERGEKSNLWWFGGRGIHIARVYRTCLNFFYTHLHCSLLLSKKEPSFCGVFVGSDVSKTSLAAIQRQQIHERSVIGFWLCTQHRYTISQSSEMPQDRFILTTDVMKNEGLFFGCSTLPGYFSVF